MEMHKLEPVVLDGPEQRDTEAVEGHLMWPCRIRRKHVSCHKHPVRALHAHLEILLGDLLGLDAVLRHMVHIGIKRLGDKAVLVRARSDIGEALMHIGTTGLWILSPQGADNLFGCSQCFLRERTLHGNHLFWRVLQEAPHRYLSVQIYQLLNLVLQILNERWVIANKYMSNQMKAISEQDNMPPAAENLPSAQPGPPAPEYRKVRTSALPCHPAGALPESNIPLAETQHARYRTFPPSGTLPCKEATNILFLPPARGAGDEEAEDKVRRDS